MFDTQGPGADPHEAQRKTAIRADMMGYFLRDARLRLIVSQACMFLLLALWWRFADHTVLLAWLAMGLAVAIALLLVERPYWRDLGALHTPQSQQRMIRALAPIYVAAGLFWAVPALLSITVSPVPRPIQAASNLIFIGMAAAPASGIALVPELRRCYAHGMFVILIACILFVFVKQQAPYSTYVLLLVPALQWAATVWWSDGVYRRYRKMCVLQHELADKEREARRAIETKNRLLAAATHDIRQPVAALSIFATHLVEYPDSHEEIAPKIAMATEAVNHLFDSLFEHSALENDAISVAFQDVELGALLAGLHAQFEPVARARRIDLRLRRPNGTVHTDPVRLRRIVGNMLSNAIAYSPPATRILLAGRTCHDEPCIQVWDQGIGIGASDIDKIFQAFYRAEAALTHPDVHADSRVKSIGLGLSIVAGLAQLLHIRVEVKSIVGRGTRFTLRLPTAAPAPA